MKKKKIIFDDETMENEHDYLDVEKPLEEVHAAHAQESDFSASESVSTTWSHVSDNQLYHRVTKEVTIFVLFSS